MVYCYAMITRVIWLRPAVPIAPTTRPRSSAILRQGDELVGPDGDRRSATPILVVVTRSCGSWQAAADTDAVKPAAVQAGTCRVHILACHLVEGGRAARRGHRPASHPLRD